MEYDFLVIGGGICGLEIAALCSTLGHTLVVEKTNKIGGRARVINKEGFKLDWGPHPVRFGPHSALAKTLRDVGIKDAEFIKPGLTYAYLKDGTKYIFPSGLKGYLKTKMIPTLKTIKVFFDIYRKMRKNKRAILETSIDEYCIKNQIDPRIHKFLLIGSAAMQVNPFGNRSSIGEFLLNILEVVKKKSVYYPKGGWGYFFSSLSNVIKKNGGEIRLNTEVKKIVIEKNVAVGVETETEMINSECFISVIPVQNLSKILPTNISPKNFIKKCNNLRPTAGICIEFGLSEKVSEETLVFFEDPPSFGLIPTNMDPQIAPTDKSLMSFFAPTDLDIVKDKSKRNQYYAQFRKQIMSIYPSIEEKLLFERPLFLQMVDGVEIAIDQHRMNRPKPTELDIKNLYLTGDSIGGEGAGGDIGHTSVRECFKRIVRDDKKKKDS
ncbi:MAG: FAD-dependent oxidoreductase [Candidatus Lokiarchaeota archaeon]|nr:FAD-dependent oxidoreductase [Candidatus Lokiarchaeota archaeon]